MFYIVDCLFEENLWKREFGRVHQPKYSYVIHKDVLNEKCKFSQRNLNPEMVVFRSLQNGLTGEIDAS